MIGAETSLLNCFSAVPVQHWESWPRPKGVVVAHADAARSLLLPEAKATESSREESRTRHSSPSKGKWNHEDDWQTGRSVSWCGQIRQRGAGEGEQNDVRLPPEKTVKFKTWAVDLLWVSTKSRRWPLWNLSACAQKHNGKFYSFAGSSRDLYHRLLWTF